MGKAEAQKAFVPEFTPALRRWAKSVIKRNMWRLHPDYDWDDMLGEAGCVFAVVKDRYPNIDNAAWFAGMFRRCFLNRVDRVAQYRTRRERVVGCAASQMGSPDAEGGPLDRFSGAYSGREEAELIMDLEGAPEPLLRTIRAILTGLPQETGRIAPETPEGRERANRFLCGLVGVPETTDLVGAMLGQHRRILATA